MRRTAHAVLAGLALLGAGLWLGGATGRVLALARAVASTPGIEPILGSERGTPRTVSMDGQPACVRRCVAPPGWTVARVRDHYEELAKGESNFLTPHGPGRAVLSLPYVAVDQPNGAYLLWNSTRDGHRRGVIVVGEASQVGYTLIDAGPLVPSGEPRLVLPEGIAAPSGARPGVQLQEGEGAWTFFDLPGSPGDAAKQLVTSLAGAGFTIDAAARAEIDAVRDGSKTRADASRVVVPFSGRGKRGFCIVAPSGPGLSRASLSLR